MKKNAFVRISILAAMSLLPAGAHSQPGRSSALRFDEVSRDFGNIREADGPVSHTFTFTNVSSGAVAIERVTTDCGCTATKYSREPIRPGRSGTVEVVFDPAGYWGKFDKNITVISDNGRSRNDLKVSGTVQQRDRTVEERYPYALMNGLRADNLRVAFEYVSVGSSKSMVIGLANTSDKPVRVIATVEHGSGHLRADAPHTLQPGEEGLATFTYEIPAGAPVYGLLTDRVRISANGAAGNMGVTAHAIAVDDFSKTDRSKAPECHLDPVFYNFGLTPPGTTMTKEIVISNTGNAPLAVRSVTTRAGCDCDLKEGTVIAPGQRQKFRVSMTVKESGKGIRTGGVTIIVNDPARPHREIRLAAEIE